MTQNFELKASINLVKNSKTETFYHFPKACAILSGETQAFPEQVFKRLRANLNSDIFSIFFRYSLEIELNGAQKRF